VNDWCMEWDGAARLGLAVLLGGLIGFERERRGRPARLRTMILVCLGTTLAMLVSERFYPGPLRGKVTGSCSRPFAIPAGS